VLLLFCLFIYLFFLLQKLQNSRLLQELRGFRFEDILLLTGTPLQNNTQELWTLLNFIHPEKFGYVPCPRTFDKFTKCIVHSSLDAFLVDFGELKETKQVQKLHDILKPHLVPVKLTYYEEVTKLYHYSCDG